MRHVFKKKNETNQQLALTVLHIVRCSHCVPHRAIALLPIMNDRVLQIYSAGPG